MRSCETESAEKQLSQAGGSSLWRRLFSCDGGASRGLGRWGWNMYRRLTVALLLFSSCQSKDAPSYIMLRYYQPNEGRASTICAVLQDGVVVWSADSEHGGPPLLTARVPVADVEAAIARLAETPTAASVGALHEVPYTELVIDWGDTKIRCRHYVGNPASECPPAWNEIVTLLHNWTNIAGVPYDGKILDSPTWNNPFLRELVCY